MPMRASTSTPGTRWSNGSSRRRSGPTGPARSRGLAGSGRCSTSRRRATAVSVLVAATDGVGTKLRIAIDTGNVDTIGIDLVAMCVNDLICQGAEPLFFRLFRHRQAGAGPGHTDHQRYRGRLRAVGLRPDRRRDLAEMPGMYHKGDFDLAGLAVGAMERGSDPPREVAEGDVLLGLASNGVHSNGYSLVRKLVEVSGLMGRALPLRRGHTGRGASGPDAALCPPGSGCHPRGRRACPGPYHRRRPDRKTCPASCPAPGRPDRPWGLDPAAGLPLAVAGGRFRRSRASEDLQFRHWHDPRRRPRPGRGPVGAAVGRGRDRSCPGSGHPRRGVPATAGRSCEARRAADFRRRIEHAGAGPGHGRTVGIRQRRSRCCRTSPTPLGWRARGTGRASTAAVDHRPFGRDRAAFEAALLEPLLAARADILCLAGFMRILTPGFVSHFDGRMLNIHPSLLPKYPGLHTHQRALDAGMPRRLHRPRSHRRSGRRPDPGDRRGCRCCPTIPPKPWLQAGSWFRNIASTRLRCAALRPATAPRSGFLILAPFAPPLLLPKDARRRRQRG